jgi:hypothetical protein
MSKLNATLLIAAPALAALILVGCETKAPEPAPTSKPPVTTPAKKPTAAATGASAPGATKPTSDKAAAITWTKPEAWELVDHPSSMRKATYKIKKAEGDPADAEMSVITAGGSVGANVTRWEGQFGGTKAKTEEKDNNGVKVTLVELSGTFAGGGPMMGGGGEPSKDWMMLAAIAEASSTLYFFKLTGPKKTVEAARADFDTFVGGINGK